MVIGASQEKTAATARSFVIWGEELSKKGRYAAAEKLYQRALGLVERTLGQQHPITAEVLECYADLLVKTNRRDEGVAMKTRSEAIWKTYAPHYSWRTHIQVRPSPTYLAEREGSD
jgi:Tetratricopeptide repeat